MPPTTDDRTDKDDIDDGSDVASRSLLYRQFRDLSTEIRKHDELYYGSRDGGDGGGGNTNTTNSRPVLTDDEFDALVRKEEELERQHPDLLRALQRESGLGRAATRSGRVGAGDGGDNGSTTAEPSVPADAAAAAAAATRPKRRHLVPMLSLDNVFDEDQLRGWLKKVVKAADASQGPATPGSRVTIVTEPKLDGVSLSLRYEAPATGGDNASASSSSTAPPRRLELRWASTRGDGTIGQDVTAAAKRIPGIPHSIDVSPASSSLSFPAIGGGTALEVRGEVVLPRSEFLRLRRAEAAAVAAADASRKAGADGDGTDDGDGASSSSSVIFPPVAPAAATTITSFSNPRNAASGLLLRKESEDPEEQAASNELRSLLRFYAYDLAAVEEEEDPGEEAGAGRGVTARPEMDGIRLRGLLSEWNFPLALPVEVTTIEWTDRPDVPVAASDDRDPTDDNNDDDDSSPASSASWDEWFEESIVSDSRIQPILDYFSALEEHRERLRTEDEADPLSTGSSRPADDGASRYEWGDFDVDGCVHKVADASLRSAMGYTTRSPKWAMAHKFPARSSVARLLDIVVQVGRTGALTPVAVLEPTEVGGVTVQRATLHNFKHLKDVLGGSGDDDDDDDDRIEARIPRFEPVLVQRAGDVIPQVVRRIHSGKNSALRSDGDDTDNDDDDGWISLEAPTQCPSCSSPVTCDPVRSSSSSSVAGQVVRCSGPPLLCPPRAVTSLQHAFSRDALDLTGLSEARIRQLQEAGLLRVPSDLFRLDDEGWTAIADLPGWGDKSCRNLRAVCETVASRGISLGRFVHALGIRHVGKHTSELVASRYGSVGAFLDALEKAAAAAATPPGPENGSGEAGHPFPELEDAPGIGPVAVESLLAHARTQELADATRSLAESLTVLEQKIVAAVAAEEEDGEEEDRQPLPWRGFRVVFTGSLGGRWTRSEAKEIAKRLGAAATPGSVSRSTDLVVFGEKGGKKLTKARELGVSTMEASEFVRLATDHGLLIDDDDDGVGGDA